MKLLNYRLALDVSPPRFSLNSMMKFCVTRSRCFIHIKSPKKPRAHSAMFQNPATVVLTTQELFCSGHTDEEDSLAAPRLATEILLGCTHAAPCSMPASVYQLGCPNPSAHSRPKSRCVIKSGRSKMDGAENAKKVILKTGREDGRGEEGRAYDVDEVTLEMGRPAREAVSHDPLHPMRRPFAQATARRTLSHPAGSCHNGRGKSTHSNKRNGTESRTSKGNYRLRVTIGGNVFF